MTYALKDVCIQILALLDSQLLFDIRCVDRRQFLRIGHAQVVPTLNAANANFDHCSCLIR